MAFQLGGDRKLLTASVSEDAGPPLKSFLFDVDEADRFEAYGKYCLVGCAINQWRTSRRWRREDIEILISAQVRPRSRTSRRRSPD